MRWGSFDPFLVGDAFWQNRMGMPVANREFLRALLQYGTFESYTFFCEDSNQRKEFHQTLSRLVPAECLQRVKLSLQMLFLEELKNGMVDVMHQGDFTFFMPYMIELRNRKAASFPFPISGGTHALDTTVLYDKCIHILLARPRPFDTVVCTSRCASEILKTTFEHIRETMAASFGARIPEPPSFARIPLGIPEEAFISQDRNECRQKLGIPKHHFVMLSVARFSLRNKMDLSPLLECIEWLTRGKDVRLPPDFTLFLAGAGRASDLHLAQDLINRLGLQDKVKIEANIDYERKMLLYGAADVFLSLVDNYQETFGLTIIEAMAQGLPVIASDFSGYKDLVSHGQTGFLIPTYASLVQEPWDSLSGVLGTSVLRLARAQKVSFDMSQLAEGILILAGNSDLRRKMGLRARIHADCFHWRWVIQLYEDLWRDRQALAADWMASHKEMDTPPPVLTPCAHKSFSSYPSQWLSPKTRLTMTGYGRARLQDAFEPVIYQEMATVMNEKCRTFLVDFLSGKEETIAGLVEECRLYGSLSMESVVLNLDWLMKHGWVTICRESAQEGLEEKTLLTLLSKNSD